MNLQNYNLDIGYALGNGMVLRSITGYNDTDLEITSVPSAADVFFRQDNRMDGDFMQEFRLEMNEEIAGLTGVASLFYGDFDQHSESYILYYQAFPVQDGTFDNSTETWAAYADFRYRLTDSLSLLFGGRYQDDTVRNQADVESALSGGSQYDLESGFDMFLPKAGLSLDITDNQTVAATASRGYRQGFAERRLGSEAGLVDVDPEFVWAYEIAYRISALNNRLLLGANVFYNDYTDQQITVTNPDFAPLTNTMNAGDSESWGAEIEAQLAFDNGLRIYGSLGLLETELGDFPAEDCSNGSCDGNQYSEAPEVTASLGGEYRHDSGFFASLAASYTDSFYRSVDNADDLEVDSSFVVDAKIGYDFGHFRVSAYANNVFDEEYLTGISNANSAFIGDPRAMGVEVTAAF
ncbi:TonB-dependent receptor [Parahaliea aestuarii]|uniref:TonB-dependent receptor n=1 Tax=Parahaliea aestuarii TaxID=1852021 RepID=A0A5C9A0V7_9GAMM|nr:TonB-dependent receptor [Parahaliea aestuarii]TXS94396.1 TonB-dependent receptor [Parahaliea aestuarii]